MITAFVVGWHIFVGSLIYHDIKHGDDIPPLSTYATGCYTIYQYYYPSLDHPLTIPRDTRSVICWQRSRLVTKN